MARRRRLWWIRLLHTIVWAVFAGSILAIPAVALAGAYLLGLWLALFVLVEVGVLLVNRMRCPLTDVAARYAEDHPGGPPVGFDIFLPPWLARNNKLIFGTLYGVGVGVLLVVWLAA